MAISTAGEANHKQVGVWRSIEDITGCWAMNKHLSTGVDPMFKMQRVNWLVRRALKSATIYLRFVQHKAFNPETSKTVIHLDITQTTSVNIAPIKDSRTLNGEPRVHKDHIFGSIITQSQSVRGTKDNEGIVRPDVEPSLGVSDEKVKRFLRGEINVDGSECEGFLVEEPQSEGYGEGSGLWTHTLEREEHLVWAAETVWGFEIIEGERVLTSRVVVVDSQSYEMVRCVFQFIGEAK